MENYYLNASFLISAAKLAQLPVDEGGEVAFAGRSNAGKSSAINVLTNNQGLARTSKTPGRTQLINYFQLDEKNRIVDLPGYGYAKVPRKIKQQWGSLLDEYLRTRESLKGLILLMDCRHPLKEFDQQLLGWCNQTQLPVHILLTKSDKFKRGAAKSVLLSVQRDIAGLFDNNAGIISIQLFSALKKTGVDELIMTLDKWLNIKHNGS